MLRNRPVNDFFPGLRTRWRCCAFAAALTLALAGCGPAPPVPGDSPAAAQLTMEAQQLASMGRVNEAMARLAEAKRADPRATAPYLAQAQLLERSAHGREAFEQLAAAHAVAPQDAGVTLALLREMPPSYPAAEKEALARQAVAQAPASGEAHYLLAQAVVERADPPRYSEALREFEEASRLAPGSAVTLIDKARLYSRMGDDRRASATLGLAAYILEQQPVHGPVPIQALEEWLKQRRAAAFWLAQAAQRLGRAADVRARQAEAARLSEAAAELRRLKDRAGAVPPDPAARARLAHIEHRGVDAWNR